MQPKKILICDDEEGVRESLKIIIGEHYPLIACENPEAAIHALAHDKNIGVCLLDIKMPAINGLELLPLIKKDYPHIKIIMVTGYKSVEIAAESTRLGASGYIVKPFKAEEILESIKRNLK